MKNPYLTFDDVLILPAYSDIESRTEINIAQDLWGQNIKLPIISANMDYVTEIDMATEMWVNGGLGILHRFYDWEMQKQDVYRLWDLGANPVISVGIRNIPESLSRIGQFSENVLLAVNIDVAHGYHVKVEKLIRLIKEKYPRTKVIAGNVATAQGFKYLAFAGADAVKVGIGPGSVCTTRTVTGVGVPQLSAIINCAEAKDSWSEIHHVKIIADGGIKNSGDIVKALASGADFVMLGYLLAGHDECPGEPITANGRTYKPYRGQSIFGSNGFRSSPEGIEGYIEARGPLDRTIQKLSEGIRSGMSYVGARTLDELRVKAKFIEVSSGTQLENATRVQERI